MPYHSHHMAVLVGAIMAYQSHHVTVLEGTIMAYQSHHVAVLMCAIMALPVGVLIPGSLARHAHRRVAPPCAEWQQQLIAYSWQSRQTSCFKQHRGAAGHAAPSSSRAALSVLL